MILTLTPNGNGGSAQHSRGPTTSGTNFSKCQTNDGDTSYCHNTNLSSSANLVEDCYAFTDPGAAYSVQGINSITVKLIVRVAVLSGTASITPILRVSSVIYPGSDIAISNATYELKSQTWTTNPSTGLAWTWAQVTAIQGGYRSQAAGDGITPTEIHITFASIDVDFQKSFIPSTPSVTYTPQQPTFTPYNYSSFEPLNSVTVSLTPQQPTFTPFNYFGFTPDNPVSVTFSPVQPSYTAAEVTLPRATSIAIGGGKFRASGTMRSPARHSLTVGAQSPGIGLALIGASEIFTAVSHTYTATMKKRATVNAATPTTVFSDRSCSWFQRDYDKSAIIYLGLETNDVSVGGNYWLQFKAVSIATGAIDYIGSIEVTVGPAI